MTGTARLDGWTMWHGPSPKMAWYWFSPSTAKQREPPFFRQWNSSLRKYQQRGRCMQVAADRAHVADLRRADVLGRGRERGILPAHGGVLGEIGQLRPPRRCAVRRRRPLIVGVEVLDVDEPLGRDDVVLHQAEQIHAAGERQDAAALGGERRDRFLLVRRVDVGEGFQFVPPARSSSVSSLSGVIGMLRIVTPVALRTALAMAAAVATAGGSPMPMTPRSG